MQENCGRSYKHYSVSKALGFFSSLIYVVFVLKVVLYYDHCVQNVNNPSSLLSYFLLMERAEATLKTSDISHAQKIEGAEKQY